MTGAVRNFVDSNDGVYSGKLALAKGRLDRKGTPGEDPQFLADVDGTIKRADESYVFDTAITGTFVGSKQQAIAGVITGRINSSSSGRVRIDDDGGIFLAER